MAYGLHYYSEFADDWEKKYRVEIHERDYSGDTLKVTSGGSPFLLEMVNVDNIFTSIRPKKASIEWTSEIGSAFEIEDLFITDDRKYILYLYKFSDDEEDLIRIYTGYLVTVDCEEPFQSKPYHVQLASICGLSFLRDQYFLGYSGEFTIERISIKDIIGQCLYASGLNLDFHVYVDMLEIQMSQSDDWLVQTEIDADGLRGLTCYEALEGVLNSFNAYIVQDNNTWVIKGIPDSNAKSCRVRKYNATGQSLGTSIVDQSASIGREEYDANTPHLIPTANVVKKLADVSSIVKTTISPGIAVNRLENGQFAKPILGGNMVGWNINLNGMRYPSDGLESKGWQRTGSGTIDSPYRFEMRGTVRPGNSNDFDINISTKVPIIIDAGLFDKDQKVKIIVSGAFRSRDISQMDIACRLNDGDRDFIDWLSVDGKWERQKKSRTNLIVKVDTNATTDISIPVSDLPLQTFEVKSDIITNYLNRNGHSIANLYFSVYPGVEIPKNPGKAPLLVIEDFAVCITTETIYEGEHTYVVDAKLPIRNANEIEAKSIIADKINIITPEQVRLTNRVMTGYASLASNSALTYGWRRNIGGLPDPTGDIWLPLQFKTIRERLRQLCGKRVVLEGSFLGYDLQSSSVVFSSYDSLGVPEIFYTITGWKWDVKNREFDIRINELSLENLTTQQEFVELSKEGSGTRGNRLYGNYSGGATSGNGNGTANPIEPITLDPIDPLYFIATKTSTQTFDLGSYITSAQLPEDLVTSIVYYPTWMLAPYEDRGVDGDILTYTVTGKPLQKGHDQIVIELTGEDQQKYLAVIPIIIELEVLNKNTIINGDGDLIGKVPGFLELPESWNFQTVVTGTHDSVQIVVAGGGASGTSYSGNITREPGLVESGTYTVSDTPIVSEAGVYNYIIVTYRGTTETSRDTGSFTLYDEEYLGKFSAEFIDASTDEILAVINPDGSNVFTKKSGWDIKSIITDLNHDKVVFALIKDGEQVFAIEYPTSPPVEEAEYKLFNSVLDTYGSGKYELLANFYLLDVPVYQRLTSFEIGVEEPKPEAGLSLVEFTPNTSNYTVTQELPLFNAEFDLPDNWGVITTIPSVDYDFVEWELFDSTGGALANVNIEAYTNYPQYLNYSEGEDKEPILFFGLKNSTDIGDIHRAPSSFRAKATFRLGGATGDIVSIFQSDFGFRVPLQPEDYSGTRFIITNSVSGDIEVVDVDMPKIGRKYILPEIPFRWSVSVREWDGTIFDKVVVKLSKDIGGSYTPLHFFSGDIVLTYNSPTDVNELPSDDLAYIIGALNSDGLRQLLDPSNTAILIDEIGKYKATFEFSLDSVVLGNKITEFELIDSTIPDIPIKDCCGGGSGDLPVYDVEGVWGGDNKLLKITFTENGTASSVEEEPLDGVSIVDDVWQFDFPPRSATAATVNDELVNFGQLTAAVASGSADKTPVKTVSTTNIALTGLQTINGYTTIAGDRVLVQNQTNPALNGAYIASSGAWGRASDSDTGAELLGATYLVTAGNSTVIGTKWKVITQPITVGVTPINIIQIEAAESDPTVPIWVKDITSLQITNWDTAYTFVTNFNSYFDTRFATKTTTNLSEGTNLYFTEARVRATVLTGLSISNSVITASDSVLSAFGKFQGQINNIVSSGSTGSGTANYLTKWTGLHSQSNSVAYELGGNISIGGSIAPEKLSVNGNIEITTAAIPISFTAANLSGVYAPVIDYGINWTGTRVDINYRGAFFRMGTTAASPPFQWFYRPPASSTPIELAFLTNTGILGASSFYSTVATGTAPLSVFSATLVTNLNADLLDGKHASEFALITDLSVYVTNANFNSLWDARLTTKTTTNLSEGSNLYFTEARVRSTPLTGLSILSGVISATDSVLSAFGKIQGQINSISSSGLTGSGTSGSLLKYLTATTVGNSIASESGTELTVAGQVNAVRYQSSSAPSSNQITGFNFASNGSLRWVVGRLGLESGSNTGSDFYFTALDDGGGFLGHSFSIQRSNRIATFYNNVIGVDPVANNHLATKNYVDNLSGKEPTITPGTTSQYWRGDKTWQTLPSFSGIAGGGTVNYIPFFNTTSSITNSYAYQTGNYFNITTSTRLGYNGVWPYLAMENNSGAIGFSFYKSNNTEGIQFSYTASSNELSVARIGGASILAMLSNGSLALYAGSVSPLTVTSTALNVNFNADLLDGKHASEFALVGSVYDRFISNPIETTNINNLINGGVKTTGENALNSPFNYGSILTFVGNSSTGNGETVGSFVNQLLVSTTNDIYHRQRIDGNWSVAYQYWTSKQFTSTNISNWNTAFGWGNHATVGYYLASNPAGYISTISSSQIITALGYTPLRGDSYIVINGTGYALNTNPSITISGGGGSVTAVGLSVPSGFTVTSSPVTSSGNLSFDFASGYSLPSNSTQSYWSAKMDGGKTITINGNTQNINDNPSFSISGGGTGVPTDRTITINGNTQYLVNNPNFTISGGGGIPTDRTITINGSTQYLNDNPNFTISGGGSGVSGSGTNGYVAKWTGASSIGNSRIYDIGSGNVEISANVVMNSLVTNGTINSVSGMSIGSGGLNSSSILQLNSNSKGFLPPRMSRSEKLSISSPSDGLIVWQTDSPSGSQSGLYVASGGSWLRLTNATTPS